MDKFINIMETISEHSGRWVSWIVYVGIIFLSLEVVLRYVFNSPTVWAHGYTQRLFGGYFILIGAYTLAHKGHVRVDVIYNSLPKKAQGVLDLVNMFFLLIWSGVMIPVSWNFFVKSYSISEVDEMVLAHPIWWVKFLIIIGMALIFLQGVSEVLKVCREMSGRNSTSDNMERREA